MPDSSSLLTRERVIARAYGLCGIDTVSTDEGALGAEVLNDLLAELGPEVKPLWATSNTEYSLTTVALQRSYATGVLATTIPAYIQSIEAICVYIGATSRNPIRLISKEESLKTFELETTSGEPYMAYLELASDPANQKLHLFPTPDAAYTIRFAYERMLYDADLAADVVDVMRSQRLSLIKVLAYELSGDAGVALQQRQLMFGEAEKARAKIMALNKEKKDTVPATPEYF